MAHGIPIPRELFDPFDTKMTHFGVKMVLLRVVFAILVGLKLIPIVLVMHITITYSSNFPYHPEVLVLADALEPTGS